MTTDLTAGQRAGYIFIAAGLLVACAVAGVLLTLVARGGIPDGVLVTLGAVAAAGVGVALFGALTIDPKSSGEALTRVERTAAAVLPAVLSREPVRLQPPPDAGAVVERAGAPDVYVPPAASGAAPVQVRADDPADAAPAVVAQRLYATDAPSNALPMRDRNGRFRRRADALAAMERDAEDLRESVGRPRDFRQASLVPGREALGEWVRGVLDDPKPDYSQAVDEAVKAVALLNEMRRRAKAGATAPSEGTPAPAGAEPSV